MGRENLPIDVVLRTAEEEDLDDLLRLARAFYDEDGFATSDEDLRRNLSTLLRVPNTHVVVAVRNSTPCAFALTTTTDTLESGIVAELQDLYVEPHLRRRGIAGSLIADAADWSRARAASFLEVTIAPNGHDVTHLLCFYAARGFRNEDRRILSLPL